MFIAKFFAYSGTVRHAEKCIFLIIRINYKTRHFTFKSNVIYYMLDQRFCEGDKLHNKQLLKYVNFHISQLGGMRATVKCWKIFKFLCIIYEIYLI